MIFTFRLCVGKNWLFDFCEAWACVSGKRQCANCGSARENKKCGSAKNKTLSGRLAWSQSVRFDFLLCLCMSSCQFSCRCLFFRLVGNVLRVGACFNSAYTLLRARLFFANCKALLFLTLDRYGVQTTCKAL